jgi:hypothetical protein
MNSPIFQRPPHACRRSCAAGITVILAVALEDALHHSLLGKIFPSAVAVIGLTMTLFLIPQLMRGAPGHATHFDAELSDDYAGQAGIGSL